MNDVTASPPPVDPAVVPDQHDAPHHAPVPEPAAVDAPAPATLEPATPAEPVTAEAATPPADEEAPSVEFASALADHEKAKVNAAVAAKAAAPLKPGAKRKVTVVSIGDENILVDFGGRSEGLVETKHYKNEDGSVRVQAGEVLELFVLEAGDQVTFGPSFKTEGKPKRDNLKHVRDAHASGVPVSGKVSSVNSGGLAVDLGGVRGFCPMSQIELGFCSDPSKYVGKTLEFLVTAIEEGRGSAVISRRQLLKKHEDETGKEMIATLKPGDEREGTVVRLEAFGAFVDLGGVDGMVHVSEIRHERTGHPNQVLTEGQKVNVRVLRIEAGKDGKPRIALSMKATAADPWANVAQQFAPGQKVSGTVARLTDFGAFVNLAPGIDGLVHVSEISYERVNHPKDVLKPGQQVEAVVQGVDAEKKRVSLSIKKTLEAPEGWTQAAPARVGEGGGEVGPGGMRGERGDRGPRGERMERGGGGAGRGGERSERGPRGGGGGGGRSDRGGDRGGRGGRDGGGDREHGGRGERSREPRYVQMPLQQSNPDEPTTMALALRKAMEEAKKREQKDS
jgi:small subunit ribosomal protein S1